MQNSTANARTSDLNFFTIIITAHETCQNYIKFTEIPNTDFEQLKDYLQKNYPDGKFLSESLYSDSVYFYTVLSGFSPSTVTVTDHDFYHFNPTS